MSKIKSTTARELYREREAARRERVESRRMARKGKAIVTGRASK